MEIFQITNNFPPQEKYELTDQLRRSSRSVCRAIGEGYRKRQYPKHFSSKMSDADMENSETQVSLDLALACKYISNDQYKELILKSEETPMPITFEQMIKLYWVFHRIPIYIKD